MSTDPILHGEAQSVLSRINPFLDGQLEFINWQGGMRHRGDVPLEEYARAVASGNVRIQTDLQEQLDDVAQNPDRRNVTKEPNFRIFVPVSGGLDSMTALAMAVEAGHDVVAIYVDTGAEYGPYEQDMVDENVFHHSLQIEKEGRPQSLAWEIIELDVDYKKYEHVDRGRNLIAIMAVAAYADRHNLWGEVWFGNLAEYGESGVVAGDKSHRFFIEVNALLHYAELPVQVRSPLAGLNKSDLVLWWYHHYGDAADGWLECQWSCHSDDITHCGRCSGCFSRWVAFKELDMEPIPKMTEPDFSEKLLLAKERWDQPDDNSLAHSRIRLKRYMDVADL